MVALREKTCRKDQHGQHSARSILLPCFGVRFRSSGNTLQGNLRGYYITWYVPGSSTQAHCPGGKGWQGWGSSHFSTGALHCLLYSFVLIYWAPRGSSWVPVVCTSALVILAEGDWSCLESPMANNHQKPFVPQNKTLPFSSPTCWGILFV